MSHEDRDLQSLLNSKKCGSHSGLILQLGLFDGHVFEFTRLENLATFQALYVFRIFVAGHNLHTWVFARRFIRARFLASRVLGARVWSSCRRNGRHRSGILILAREG
jgi:hypothetical protein